MNAFMRFCCSRFTYSSKRSMAMHRPTRPRSETAAKHKRDRAQWAGAMDRSNGQGDEREHRDLSTANLVLEAAERVQRNGHQLDELVPLTGARGALPL
eukprot:scaffold62203_cov35-Phaeocystis_antarctica.AAC.2